MTRPVSRGENPPLEIFAPPWKNELDIVQHHWTKFKQFRPLSENPSPLLVSQAGYWSVYDCLVISEARTTSKLKRFRQIDNEQYNSHTGPCTVYV